MVHAMSHAVSENLKWPRAHSPVQPGSFWYSSRAIELVQSQHVATKILQAVLVQGHWATYR